MSKSLTKTGAIALTMLTVISFAASPIVHAQRGQESPEVETERSESPEPSKTPEVERSFKALRERAEVEKERVREVQQERREKRDEARVDRCEKRQENLKKRYENINTNADRALTRINQRLVRAQEFVAKKGLVIDNANQLLADISSKQTAAQAALATVRTTAQGFDCANDDASAQAQLIKAQVEAFKAAVKEYRDSVKAYFRAVITEFSDTRVSPSTSVSPSVSPAGGVQ